MRRLLRLLETLNTTHSGSTIYQHIERSFHDLESARLENECHYIELLELLFDALTRQVGRDSPLQPHIHILRTSLIAPMQPHELQQLKEESRRLITQLLHPRTGSSPLEQAFDPLLSLTSRPQGRSAPASPWLNTGERNETSTPREISAKPADPPPQPAPPLSPESGANIQGIKEMLDEQVSRALEYTKALAQLIRESMETAQQMDGAEDPGAMRATHLRRYNQLIREHQDLTTRFSAIQQQLGQVESESQQLGEELNRIRKLSLTDELTQLPNRRALMQRLDDEVARVQRYGSPLALAIIDLDEFKPINDTYGHNAGDAVLRYFAETALTVFRHHDIIARYGGEEFAVLMPNTGIEGALSALNKIQNEVGAALCRLDDGMEIHLPTFSAGVALYNPGEVPEELIKRADTAMYRAKRSGRNRIEVHTMGARQKASMP